VQAFLERVARETETPSVPPVVQRETLRDALDAGSPAAPEQLGALAAAHPDDAALYCDVLPGVSPEALMPALMADPPRAVGVVRAMPELLGTHRPPERGEVDAVILWLFAVARHAVDAAELHLLKECCDGAFTWDALRDQWRPQDEISPGLLTLTGEAAGSVEGALRDTRTAHTTSPFWPTTSASTTGSAQPSRARPLPAPHRRQPRAPGRPHRAADPGARARPVRPPSGKLPPPFSTAGPWSAGDGPRINEVAGRLPLLTPEARALLAQVLEHGDSSGRHITLPGAEIRLPRDELSRRAEVGTREISDPFGELECRGFGHIDLDPDFGEAPPEVVVFDSPDRQSGTTVLSEMRDFATEADVPLDLMVNGRFDLLD
jgi:hypothetical protein